MGVYDFGLLWRKFCFIYQRYIFLIKTEKVGTHFRQF